MSDIYGAPATGAGAVTPSDSTVVNARSLYIGVGGNLKVTMDNGSIFEAPVASYAILPIKAKIVWSTGTSATDIVALY